MHAHCPDCGSTFHQPRDFTRWWIRLLQCPKRCGWFLEVVDMRWIYGLSRLDAGVGKRLCEADDSLIETAVKRIKTIDCKTVSTVFFEHTILGCYEESREYDVVYRQQT